MSPEVLKELERLTKEGGHYMIICGRNMGKTYAFESTSRFFNRKKKDKNNE